MRVSKNKVTLLSLAVAGLFATAAQAQITVDPVPGTGAKTYASELKFPLAGLLVGGANVTTTTILGFGLSNLQDRYIRYDLVGGATFALQVLAGDLAVTTSTPAVVQGGAPGDSYVVFQITSTANVAASGTAVFTPQAAGIKIPTATSQQIRYTLHETAVSAQTVGAGPNPGGANINNGRLVDKTADLVKFAKVLGFTMNASTPETSAATSLFKSFCAPNPNTGLPGTAGCLVANTDNIAVAGTVATYGLLNITTLDLTSTAITGLSTVLASATLTATTDATTFQAAGTAGFTNGTANCLVLGTAGAVNATFTTLTYTLPAPTAAATPLAGATALCYGVDGTTTVGPQKFTGSFNPVYTAGYTGAAAVSVGQIGEIVRDGAELQSPWFSFGGTRYISRFFFMNTGAGAATCTSTALAETGNTLTVGSAGTTGFTIPAGGQVAVLATDVVSAATGAGRAAVRFVCLAASANIQGRYVITDTTSGALDSGVLLRPGTN